MNGRKRGGITITRATLRESVYSAIGTISRNDARKLLDDALDEMCDILESGETLKLRGFGTFKVLSKRERIGRNPKTKVDAIISARRVISFKPSPVIIAKVNGEEVPIEYDDE